MTVPLHEVVAVVLAGGFGTRIQELLPGLPKPMAPVLGKPFVEWVVRLLAAQGVRQVVLATGYRAETVAQHFRSQPVSGVTVTCVAETTPLGTAGGFRHAAHSSGHTPPAWLVLNGDSLVLAPLAPLADFLAEPQVVGALLGVSVPDAARFGTLAFNAQQDLLGFTEKKPGAGVISAGVYLLRDTVLAGFPAVTPLSFETGVFPALTTRHPQLKVHVADAPFLDIGTPESLPQAEAFIRQHGRHFLG